MRTIGRALFVWLLCCTASPTRARADTTVEDLAKYWKLRQRLVTDFTSVGTSPGQSQPAPERNDGQAWMKWGDGTIALGFYLGVLASEHYILSNPTIFPGADMGDASRLTTTRNELYSALAALERLDNVADASFPAPCTTTPALNGFFVRDDVPADFYMHFAGITTIMSDYIDPTLTNKEESQDQVYHVQHGLSLVATLVPDSVMVSGKGLRAWAISLGQAIAGHFATGDWVIRNPACANRTVNRGGNAIGYSYGETLAVAFMTNGGLKPTTDPAWMTIWNTLKSSVNPAYNDVDNLHMALAIMAVGDGYGADTADVVATLAATQDWPVYPLMHRVLHGGAATGWCTTGPMVNTRARVQLDELPITDEPHCPGAAGPLVHGWTSHNRYIRGKDQAYVGPGGCDGIRYHGLDYMLLHNLYAIATPGTWMGAPDADVCPPVPDAAMAADLGPSSGDDGGTTPPDGGDGGTTPPVITSSSGCACDLGGSSRAPVALVVLLLVALSLSRELRRRRS